MSTMTQMVNEPRPMAQCDPTQRLEAWVANYHIEDTTAIILTTREEKAFPYVHPLLLVGKFDVLGILWIHKVTWDVIGECHSLTMEDKERVWVYEVPWPSCPQGEECHVFRATLNDSLLFFIVARRIQVLGA